MSGTKERELNFQLNSWKQIPFKRRGCFPLTPYVMHWWHILKNNGQSVLSAQSKYSDWTVRLFSKCLSPSAFKISSCCKVPLLCLHCLLSVASMKGLSLMPECHQMLRECLDEWQWGRDTRRLKPCISEFKHSSQSDCLKQRCWTRVLRRQKWPETWSRNS